MKRVFQDGVVSFWTSALDHKRTRTIQTPGDQTQKKPKWITDFVLMPQYNKFILGTGYVYSSLSLMRKRERREA